MELKDRLKELREALGITQSELAEAIGLAKNTVAKYEIGYRVPMEATLKLICSKYDVNYLWLTEGNGEMFSILPDELIQKICQKYGLESYWVDAMRKFLELSDNERKVIKKYLKKLSEIKDD